MLLSLSSPILSLSLLAAAAASQDADHSSGTRTTRVGREGEGSVQAGTLSASVYVSDHVIRRADSARQHGSMGERENLSDFREAIDRSDSQRHEERARRGTWLSAASASA